MDAGFDLVLFPTIWRDQLPGLVGGRGIARITRNVHPGGRELLARSLRPWPVDDGGDHHGRSDDLLLVELRRDVAAGDAGRQFAAFPPP
jgi:hypothetical protein